MRKSKIRGEDFRPPGVSEFDERYFNFDSETLENELCEFHLHRIFGFSLNFRTEGLSLAVSLNCITKLVKNLEIAKQYQDFC